MEKDNSIKQKLTKLALLTTIIVGGNFIMPANPTLAQNIKFDGDGIEIASDFEDDVERFFWLIDRRSRLYRPYDRYRRYDRGYWRRDRDDRRRDWRYDRKYHGRYRRYDHRDWRYDRDDFHRDWKEEHRDFHRDWKRDRREWKDLRDDIRDEWRDINRDRRRRWRDRD